MNGFAPSMPTKSISLKKVKGLPKRASQAQHKARRQACWTRGEERKADRRALQALRTRTNDAIRRERKELLPYTPVSNLPPRMLTPWELSKYNRRIKRAKLQKKVVVTVTPKAEES